jgi:perosamine synthetase
MIPLSQPDIGEREIEYVTAVLRSGRLSLGPLLEEFERAFAAYIGAGEAIAVSSGTAALHLIVKSLGIGQGDEVFTTAFSFAASTNCLLYEGATPAFVDVEPQSFNLDVACLRAKIDQDYICDRAGLKNRRSGRHARAILAVHVFGLPCNMDALIEVAKEFGLAVIEDACEALGATWAGRRVGQFGDAAAFGFYPNKQITTAEGGVVVTQRSEIARVCRSLRNQGRDESAQWLRHERLGHNYRLSELHCALGLAQLERVDELCAARERAARLYTERLAHTKELALLDPQPHATRSWFTFVVQLRCFEDVASVAAARDALMRGLRARGIACQAYFPAIHLQPYIRNIPALTRISLPRTEYAAAGCVALPLFPAITEEQIDEVCFAVREVVAEISQPQEAPRTTGDDPAFAWRTA